MDVLLKALESAFGSRCAGAIQQDQTQQRQTSHVAGRVTLISSVVAAPVSVAARPHTYFGR